MQCFRGSREDEIEILHKRLLTKLVIAEDGHCTWDAPVTLNSQCEIDVTRFPFDEQTCDVKIGSWTYPAHKINVSYSDRNVAMNDYIRNGEWDIKSATLSHNVRYYLPDNIPFPDVTLTLEIKRRSLYYGLQLILPLTVISMLTFLSFILPLRSEEQISLLVNLVVAISVYSVIISSVLPETSDSSSVLQKYCIGIFLSVAIVSFPAVLKTRLVDLSNPMPNWFRKFMKLIAKFLRVNSEGLAKISNGQQNNEVGNNGENGHELTNPAGDQENVATREIQNQENVSKHQKQWETATKVIHKSFFVVFFLFFVGFNLFLLVEFWK